KSMPKFRPGQNSERKLPPTMMLEMIAHRRRYLRKSIVCSGLKNSMTSPHPKALHTQAADQPLEHHARAEHTGEQRRADTDHQRDREALDRAGAVLEQDHRRDERGQLTVEDRPERAREALLHRGARRLAGA